MVSLPVCWATIWKRHRSYIVAVVGQDMLEDQLRERGEIGEIGSSLFTTWLHGGRNTIDTFIY